MTDAQYVELLAVVLRNQMIIMNHLEVLINNQTHIPDRQLSHRYDATKKALTDLGLSPF